VATNQTVSFTVSAFGTQRFLGTVANISPQGASTSGVVTYPVTIAVTMPSLRGAHLLPQMTANASIITAQRTGVLLVPASAVTFARTGVSNGLVTRAQTLAAVQQAQQMLTSSQNSQTGTSSGQTESVAFVLERSGSTWVVKPVVLGLTNGTYYEVVAGLANGESVVTGQTGGTTTSSTTAAAMASSAVAAVGASVAAASAEAEAEVVAAEREGRVPLPQPLPVATRRGGRASQSQPEPARTSQNQPDLVATTEEHRAWPSPITSPPRRGLARATTAPAHSAPALVPIRTTSARTISRGRPSSCAT
jgi:hypothetical protein